MVLDVNLWGMCTHTPKCTTWTEHNMKLVEPDPAAVEAYKQLVRGPDHERIVKDALVALREDKRTDDNHKGYINNVLMLYIERMNEPKSYVCNSCGCAFTAASRAKVKSCPVCLRSVREVTDGIR